MGFLPSIVVVTRQTRLQTLLRERGTCGQAKFKLKRSHEHERMRQSKTAQDQQTQAEADFEEYQQEDEVYQNVLGQLKRDLDLDLPLTFIDRQYVANFNFATAEVVVVVGQDGLVANTAKYVGDVPIVAVNPDPQRIDGVLLPFHPDQARRAVQRTLNGKNDLRSITLAEVQTNDGQKMLAFNDFFIGAKSHISARYTLQLGGEAEAQSSSGLLVCTGAGSTGWMSSVFNMTSGISQWLGGRPPKPVRLRWEDRKLLWAVREPFRSKRSSVNFVAGTLDQQEELVLESLMPSDGVIFSDGIESDYLEFNSGTIARVQVSNQQANLVVPAKSQIDRSRR